MKKILFPFFLLSLTLLYAQPKAQYYSSAEGKSQATLKTALFSVIKNPSVVSFNGLWTAFEKTDKRADGKVWDMYSNANFSFGTNQDKGSGGTSEGQFYNREHSFPKSWFSDKSPMYSDLFHLYPTDKLVNNRRSNNPYGEVGSAKWTSENGSKLGSAKSGSGYSGTVFEPIDEYKGDFARTYFYMITCYEDKITSWSSPHLASNKYPGFNEWSINVLLKWHRQDPVSKKETDRNNAVEKYQDNRNPFIDYPELVEYIWGNKMGQPWTSFVSGLEDTATEFSVYLDTAQDMIKIESEDSALSYVIYNINGQILQSGDLHNTDNQISVSDIENGLYIIKVQTETRTVIKKFIISK